MTVMHGDYDDDDGDDVDVDFGDNGRRYDDLDVDENGDNGDGDRKPSR